MATYQSQYTGQQIDAAVAFGMSPDATPTQNSTKGVTSGGVYAETSALKSALDDVEDAVFDVSSAALTADDWEQGAFVTASGATSASSTRIRSKASAIPSNGKSVVSVTGYKMLAYGWNGSTYLGVWNGSSFIKTTATGLATTSYDLSDLRAQYATIIRLVLMKDNTSADILPADGVNVNLTTQTDKIEQIETDIDNIENEIEEVYDTIDAQSYLVPLDTSGLNVVKLYINMNTHLFSDTGITEPRTVIIPAKENYAYKLTCDVASTKRAAFANVISRGGILHDEVQVTGSLDLSMKNTGGYKYLALQLFIDSDTQQDYTVYMADLEVSEKSFVDVDARESLSELDTEVTNLSSSISKFFFTEDLTGLPIVSDPSALLVDETTWDSSSAFHAMCKTNLCDVSNGYITQHLMGQDAHGNNLYYYLTHPDSVIYGAEREEVAPAYPIEGGYAVKPFRIIFTTNIHYREKNGNYVIYNLLYNMLNSNSQMLKFFKNNTEIIWIPCCCPTTNTEDGYVNADGENVNRSFPTTKEGSATCPEAVLIKEVFDTFGDGTDLHLDVHTFQSNTYFATWIFSDNAKLGARGARIAEDVLQDYAAKYPTITEFTKHGGGFVNTPTTSSYYMEHVYGVPAGTIEEKRKNDLYPLSNDLASKGAIALLYDLVTQTTIGIVR